MEQTTCDALLAHGETRLQRVIDAENIRSLLTSLSLVPLIEFYTPNHALKTKSRVTGWHGFGMRLGAQDPTYAAFKAFVSKLIADAAKEVRVGMDGTPTGGDSLGWQVDKV